MHANPSSQRLIEVDFFRGLILLFIVVDHIAGSVMARFTLRNYAIADAAEVFVFLAGLVTAMSYMALLNRRGQPDADRRFFRRSREIYVAFLITAALMVVSGLVLRSLRLDIPSLGPTEVDGFLAAPGRFIFEVITLQRQPFLSDILPMYALFALATPLFIRIGKRSLLMLGAVSLTVWLAAPMLGDRLLPVAQAGGNWTFNPFAWQALFVLGMIVGLRPSLPVDLSPRVRRGITVAAVGYALFGLCCAILWGNPALHAAVVPPWVEETFYPISKSDAALPRILSFMSVTWLVYMVARNGRLKGLAQRFSVIGMVGRNGLNCFIGAAVISLAAEGLAFALGRGEPSWPVSLFADVLAIAAVFAVAAWSEARTRRQRAANKPGAAAVPVPTATPPAAATAVSRSALPR